MEFITINDSIDVLKLSVRSSNALSRSHILTVGELLDFPIAELESIRNMGEKSVAEVKNIIESLKQATNEDFRLMSVSPSSGKSLEVVPTDRDNRIAEELQEFFGEDISFWLREIITAKQEHDSDSDDIYLFWVYKSPVIRNAVKAAILKTIDSISECRLSDIAIVVPSQGRGRILNEILTEMESEQLIAIQDNDISRMFPSLLSFVNAIPKERTRDVFIARLNGLTLDEIGQRYDLTKERVRQIIDKELNKKPRLTEDKYIYLYENYDFSLEDFKLAFGERPSVYYYLETVASLPRGKRKPVIEILVDDNVPVYLRKQAEKAAYKEYVTINGVRIRKLRREIAEYVIRTKCRELTKFEDFTELYKQQIQELGLSDNPAFELDEGTYTNKISEAEYVLWNQGHSFRYYFIPERDYDSLLTTLNLEQYQNTEFSSLKLLRDYPDLMREYDIRDEYELHNLLRKVWAKDNSNVVFKKMPTITVGNPDRDTQVLDLLLQYAPISMNDLAQEYEKAYGAKSTTVMGTYLKNFTEYYHNGIYSIEADNLPYDQFIRMRELLSEDFYFLPQIKQLYKDAFPDADESQINPYTIKTLGFKVYSGYAVRATYNAATEYFSKLLTSSDDFSLDEYPAGISLIQSFMQILYELRESREYVEYKPHCYVSQRKLDSLGVTREKINAFCEEVRDFARGKKYFTIASLREDGFNHQIGTENYDDWFYSSLLIEDKENFSYKRIGRTKVLMNGVTEVSFADMLVWIIEQRQRMTYSALNRHLEKYYGIFLAKDKLLSIIHETSLFFDPIEQEIYINYGAYNN